MAKRRKRTGPSGAKAVPARFLLEGFWYSVEQSGSLLHDATALHEAGRYGTAAGLTLLGIEERGKGRILRDLWKVGTPVTLEQITHTLGDHPRKMKAGQTLFALSAPTGSVTASFVEQAMAKAGTPEAREALQKLADLALERGKRTPHERHEARERAFYVDPDPTGTTWRRPLETTKTTAEDILLMALNDYSGQLSECNNPTGPLAEALAGWPERPSLPPLVWPQTASKPPIPRERT